MNMDSSNTVTDTLSAAAAMVEAIHEPRFSPGGFPREAQPDERMASAHEALAYAALAIAEELRAIRPALQEAADAASR